MKRLNPFLVLAVGASLLGSACEEEQLQQLEAKIALCPAEDSETEDCNRPLDLGKKALDTPFEFSVFLKNTGSAQVDIREVAPGDERLEVHAFPERVAVKKSEPVTLTLTPDTLDDDETTLLVKSNADDFPELEIPVRWEGIPKPVPEIQLCANVDGTEECGVDITLDFGLVRRSQTETRILKVRNVGQADLEVEEVVTTDNSTTAGELYLASSTRAGTLEPETEANLLVQYVPQDGDADTVTVVFNTDDPENPVATATITATSEDNELPLAVATGYDSDLTTLNVTVNEEVWVDGTASSDPEGDPLLFAWELEGPDGHGATIAGPEDAIVSFIPDRAGTYLARLVVYDTLNQASDPGAAVVVEAGPEVALRVTLDWMSGGDVDVHLVQDGSSLFDANGDCHFNNTNPDWGGAGDATDDPLIRTDAQLGPGTEELVLEAAPDGTYAVYAHYFEKGDEGVAIVDATILVDDGIGGANELTATLGSTCDLWHIGDVTFPGGTFTAAPAAITSQCP
jgi:hypothetical protein